MHRLQERIASKPKYWIFTSQRSQGCVSTARVANDRGCNQAPPTHFPRAVSDKPAQLIYAGFFTTKVRDIMAKDIPSEVKRIIKEQLDVEEKDIKPESSFIDDLGADSLGLVELVLAFEETFDIDIPDEDTEKIRTVQDAISYVEQHAKK